jgi:lipid A 4'-phosphatase
MNRQDQRVLATKEQGDQPRVRTSLASLPWSYPISASLVFVVVVSGFFLAFPGVDLWTSHLFYQKAGGFFLRHDDLLKTFRYTGRIAVIAVVVGLVAQLIGKLAKPERASLVPPSVTLFLFSTLIVGPAFLVNVVLKDHWGRPRPTAVDLFGGDSPYVVVWEITSYCDTNCSFVSGETASAFWLTALALVVPRPYRLPVALVTVVYAALLSLNRIAFGGHFLSDVLLAAGLTLLIIAIGHRLFIARPPAWLASERLEAGLTRFGERLHRRERTDAEPR